MIANEFKLKEQICEIGRRVYAKGFAAANDGNITVRLNDKEVLCTPTMVSKGFMKPTMSTKSISPANNWPGPKADQRSLAASRSLQGAPDINAVVHCHPPHATAFAVAREHSQLRLAGGRGFSG